MSRATRVLADAVADVAPAGADPVALICAGEVLVDGLPVRTPRSRLRPGQVVSLRQQPSLRGSAKLRAAFAAWSIEVAGRVALDVGAAAGGFTSVLLEEGARRVYAVDVGHGQLLGSLRQDPRVVVMESVNVADLDATMIEEPIELITIDVSYLSLRAAAAQLDRIPIDTGAVLVGLVKPMFELRRATAPRDEESLAAALAAAVAGVERTGWRVRDSMPSPVRGSRGAAELLLWAQRA